MAKAVDIRDQLKYYNTGLRPIKRGGWQSLFHWLLNTVLVNTYLLSFHSKVDKSQKFTTQLSFQQAVIQGLFAASSRTQGKRKLVQMHSNIEEFTIPVYRYIREHRGRRGDCVYCKGERHGDPPRKRVLL